MSLKDRICIKLVNLTPAIFIYHCLIRAVIEYTSQAGYDVEIKDVNFAEVTHFFERKYKLNGY